MPPISYNPICPFTGDLVRNKQRQGREGGVMKSISRGRIERMVRFLGWIGGRWAFWTRSVFVECFARGFALLLVWSPANWC